MPFLRDRRAEQKKPAQDTVTAAKAGLLALRRGREGERKVEVMGLQQRREEKGGCALGSAQQVCGVCTVQAF